MLGFLLVTAAVIAMARSSTARWERAKRAPRAPAAGPAAAEQPTVQHLAAELLHVALERTTTRARHTVPPAVSRALAGAPGHVGERLHLRCRPDADRTAPASEGTPPGGVPTTAQFERSPQRAAGSERIRRRLPGSLAGRLAHWHPHWPHRRSAPSPGTDDRTAAS